MTLPDETRQALYRAFDEVGTDRCGPSMTP